MTTTADTALASELADAVTELGGLAVRFAGIDRTCCYWPDQATRESDTDHTVMIAWIAPALAARLYPGRLDTGLVTEFAVLHDAVEVFCGDTPTLRITPAERTAKAEREHAAAEEWRRRFASRFPWLADRLLRYEQQQEPEARFVRAVDKFMPRVLHMGDRCKGLHEIGMSTAELATSMSGTAASVTAYAGEFPELLALGEELARRTLAVHAGGAR
jgi:putative hydrolase of HD superfamily